MSVLTDLVDETLRAHRNGWEVSDLLLRIRGAVEALEGLVAHAKPKTPPELAELNEYRRSESERTDEAIRAILLAASPAWLSTKAVRKALQCAAFHPLPSERTLRNHLGRIRGKRHHTVMSLSEAYAADDAAILSTPTGDPEMSLLSVPYRIAFAEASRHADDFPRLLDQLKQLEERAAERPTPSAPKQEDAA